MSDLAGRTPAHSSREMRRYPWQVRDSGQLLLVVAAGVWLVAAVAQTAAEGLQDPRIAIAFGALIAFGEVLRLNLPGDRETAPIGFAGALAYALLINVGTQFVQHSAEQVVTVATIGMIIGALPHLAVGRPDLKKPTDLRGSVGVRDCESSDRIKGL
jgi:peptidoglycan/LPS O-acetylase OafA/YrhL